jgi:outer membrane protein assembly factor BamE (lipoprotein component of BamABCDE complex)
MDTAFKPGRFRTLLAVGALVAAAAAQAASGYVVTPQQEKSVRVGMTRDEVRATLGRPAHNMKYRTEPGRTWTYGVVGSDTKVFEVDFTADNKVSSTHEVEEPVN